MEFDWMTAIKAGLTAVIGAFTAFWGWLGWLAFAWVVLMALDYITGTAAAVKAGPDFGAPAERRKDAQ